MLITLLTTNISYASLATKNVSESIEITQTPQQIDPLDIKISISVKNVTLSEFLNKLQKLIGSKAYLNMSLGNITDNKSDVTISATNETVGNVLTKVLDAKGLSYSRKGDVFMIVKKVAKVIPTIKVTVIDITTKAPISGAVVYQKATSTGSVTNTSGVVTMKNIMEGSLMEVSFVGFEKQQFIAMQPTVTINLNESVVGVDQVVVTGYQNVNARDWAGSYTKLDMKDHLLPQYTSIDQMLQGAVAGMVVTNTSARAGASAKIQIRGTTTVLGNQDPIWVVDGIIQDDPISMNAQTDMNQDMKTILGNQVSWLNPNDIEDITVLKDAHATAIYGSRASNGVIVVTLKKGKGDRVSINYSGNLSYKPAPNYGMFNMMNSQERIMFSEEAYNYGVRYQQEVIKQPHTYEGLLRMMVEGDLLMEDYLKMKGKLEMANTDWFSMLTRESFSQNHNISVSGASQKVSYSTSIGYGRDNGQEIGNSSDKLTARASVGVTLNKRMRIDFQLTGSYIHNKGYGAGINPMDYATTTSRAIQPYDEDGELVFQKKPSTYQYNKASTTLGYNIFNELENSSTDVINGRLNASLGFSYNILPGLSYKFTGGYSYGSNSNESYNGEKTFKIANTYRGYDFGTINPDNPWFAAAQLPFGGELFTVNATQTSYNIQNQLSYNKEFNQNHRISAMIGHEVRSNSNIGVSNTVWGYIPERGNMIVEPNKKVVPIGGSSDPDMLFTQLYSNRWKKDQKTDNFMSLFGTFAYTMMDRYVFNLSVRNDMSNRFGQDVNRRIDPTYSFGLMWRISEENFMEAASWISSMNVKATFGIQGNALTSLSPDLILKQGKTQRMYNEYLSIISSIPNPNLSWERTKTTNIGVDFTLFNKVTIVADAYSRSSNAVITQTIPFEHGVTAMKLNGGLIYNSGLELTVSFTPVKTKDFSLRMSINSSKNWNTSGPVKDKEIVTSNFISGASNRIIKEGYPLGGFWSYDFTGLNPQDGSAMFAFNGFTKETYNGDPSSFLVYSGEKNPYFTGGLTLSMNYKRLTLSSSFSLLLGGKKRLTSAYSEFSNGIYMPDPLVNLSKDLLDRWKKPGDEETTSIPGFMRGLTLISPPTGNGVNPMVMYAQSDELVVNSSFFRCRNISLSYRLGDAIVKKIGVNSASINASAGNLFVIADKRFKGFDPELQNSVMPKSFTLGVSIGF